MTSFEKFSSISFVQRSCDEKSNVIDHVSVRQVFHEFGQRTCGLGLEISELGYEFVGGFVGEGGCGWIWGKGGEKVAVSWGELEFDI